MKEYTITAEQVMKFVAAQYDAGYNQDEVRAMLDELLPEGESEQYL